MYKNTKNLAKSMLLKYAAGLLYILTFGVAMKGYLFIFMLLSIVIIILTVMVIHYDWNFISMEMKNK